VIWTARSWLAMTLLFAVLPAAAQEEDEGDGRAEAGALLKEGNGLLDQKKFAEALQRFEGAYRVFKSPKIFFSIAEANDKLQNYARAAQYYQRFVDEADDAPEKLGARAKQRLAALEPYIGRIAVSAEEDGVTVTIDGEVIGETPLRAQWAKAGSHKVSAQKQGFLPFETAVSVTAGQKKTVMVLLEPSSESTPEPEIVPEVSPPPASPSPSPSPAEPPKLLVSTEPQIVDKPTDVAAKASTDEGVSGWLWVGLGAAAVAGAVVSIVLVTQGGNSFLPSGELGSTSINEWQRP